MAKATIIVPAFNADSFIESTLASIRNQSFRDYECLVIDDGSTDRTPKLLAQITDPRFRVITIANSGGPARPRNIGLQEASGEYIFLFDADDVMHPEKLSNAINALDRHPQADILFTNFQVIDEDGQVTVPDYLARYDTLWKLIGGSHVSQSIIAKEALFDALLQANFIGTSSVVLRKSALGISDRFDESLRNSDDRLFWSHFATRHNAIFLNRMDHQYRDQRQAISMKPFHRRAPSKISGLLKIRELCTTSQQYRHVSKLIHSDYVTLSDSWRHQTDFIRAADALREALLFGFSFSWMRARVVLVIQQLLQKH